MYDLKIGGLCLMVKLQQYFGICQKMNDDLEQFMLYLLNKFFSCLALPLPCRKYRHNGETKERTQNKS